MLHRLHLKNVGPAPELALDLAPRLNLVTGDNGLGKSFLLDVAWYCLTRRWPQEVNPDLSSGAMALPRDRKQEAEISFSVDGEHRPQQDYSFHCEAEAEAWLGPRGRPVNPGLVLYAMADGAFTLWDPARNAQRQGEGESYTFSGRDVWQGLDNPTPYSDKLCDGLVRDWGDWQGKGDEAFQQLKKVLRGLSPNPDQPLEPGPLVKVQGTNYPTITGLGDSPPVPVVHVSSGVRRILALSYLLVWAWQEHRLASGSSSKEPTRQVIFLIDEVEAHLHPFWQRRIVRALLQVLSDLSQETNVQLLLVTHSPLVMASVEPHFDEDKDRWWDLDLNSETRQVELTPQLFARMGDANCWLREAFGFGKDDTGSVERAEAIREARKAIHKRERGETVTSEEAQRLERGLQRVLGSTDPFWNHWRSRFAERQGDQRS